MFDERMLAHFLGIFAISIYAKLRSLASSGTSSFAVFSTLVISTTLHELAHLFAIVASGSRPVNVSLLPRKMDYFDPMTGKSERSWELGSVEYVPTNPFTPFIAGFAPLLLLLPAYYAYGQWFVWFEPGYLSTICMYIALYILMFASIPSRADIAVAFNNPLGASIWLSAIGVASIYLSSGAW
jgi:hypothetical protein